VRLNHNYDKPRGKFSGVLFFVQLLNKNST